MLKAFFCDQASADGGKLHIHGIFDELVAPGFPARHDRLVLCGIIDWPYQAQGRKTFSVELLDPEQNLVFTVEGHTDVLPRPESRPPAHTHLILPMEQVVFPTPGRYRTRFVIADETLAGPDLYLTEAGHAN